MRDDVLNAVQDLKPIAAELGLSMAQLALAWVLQNRNVSAAIIGASTAEQLKHNAAAVGVEIPAEVMAKIAKIFAAVAVFDPSETKSPPARLS